MIGQHSIWKLSLAAALGFLLLAVIFRPLEMAFPAKKQRFFRPHWLTDLGFFLGQYCLWTGGVFAIISVGEAWLQGHQPAWLQGFRSAVAQQPWWLQGLEVILLSDFCIYWGHRLQHSTPLLWRFHSIHHSAEHLDWLAAHREHPLDTLYTISIINFPGMLFGFPMETLAGFVAFRGIWAIYIHSNVKLPLGPLRMLIGAPELHHWHHDKARDAGNYANISPLMDILFGTYRHPDHEPEAFGISEPIAQSYWRQLLHPFRLKGTKRGEN